MMLHSIVCPRPFPVFLTEKRVRWPNSPHFILPLIISLTPRGVDGFTHRSQFPRRPQRSPCASRVNVSSTWKLRSMGKGSKSLLNPRAKRVVAVISQVIKMYSGHSVLCTLAFCTLISVFTAIWVRLYPDLVTRAFGQCNFFGEGALATCPPTHLKLSGVVLPLKWFSKKVYLHNLKQLFPIKYSCSSN